MLNDIKKIVNNELNQLAYNAQSIKSFGNPVVYQIELTNNCPMTCIMCPRTTSMTRELGYMEEALFKKIIQEASEFSSKIFFHHFGDSLMHPKIGEFIAYAKQHNIKAFLSANPALLTEKRAKELIDNGLHELVLSLDGLTEQTSASIRGKAAANVELAEKNILFFLKYRASVGSKTPFLILQIVGQKQNAHEIQPWLEKWTRVEGIDKVKVKSYITWDGQDNYIKSQKIEQGKLHGLDGIVCDKPWTSMTILWDGRVVPCCFDYNGIYVLGDLQKQSLNEIWQDSKIKYLRQCHSAGNRQAIKLCEKCTDMEGYAVRKWYYPLNRWLTQENKLGDEWSIPLISKNNYKSELKKKNSEQ